MKININGKEIEAREVQLLSIKGNSVELKLSDGHILEAMVEIGKIYRIEDLPNGIPQYQLQTKVVVEVKQ